MIKVVGEMKQRGLAECGQKSSGESLQIVDSGTVMHTGGNTVPSWSMHTWRVEMERREAIHVFKSTLGLIHKYI